MGVYLLIAWASYSPLDNAWSVASSITQTTLNKTGHFGAWSIDMLYAMFGKVAVLVPIALIIFSIYSLGMGLSVDMKWKTVFIRLASFLLLMVGLAGLFSVLFQTQLIICRVALSVEFGRQYYLILSDNLVPY